MPRFCGFQNRKTEICGIDVAASLRSVNTRTRPIDFNNKVDDWASGGMEIVLWRTGSRRRFRVSIWVVDEVPTR